MAIGQNNINNFQLKKVTIKTYDLLPQAVGELNIYEGITNPGITGGITIADWQGYNELGQIFGGDDITISFSSQNRDDLVLKYKIYASKTSASIGGTQQPITYYFCSPWLIDAFTRQISKSYKDKYAHEIIVDLLTECGANIGFVEPSKQKLPRFTTPLWTAIKSIHHILSFMVNQQGAGGYVFWTDMKTGKVNVTTMDYLLKGSYGKEPNKFMSLPLNEFYESRVDDLTFESYFDIIQALNQGAAKTIQQAYNYDKNLPYTFNKSINEVPYTHLSTKFPINASYNTEKYATIKGCYIYPMKDDQVTDDKMFSDLVDGKAKTRYVRLSADTFKINIITNPNSSRRAGHLAELEYQSTDKSIVTKNKLYSGMYLIRNIRHAIFNGTYTQAVTLIADGFKESKNDLITW
jgi:hypothetical protein